MPEILTQVQGDEDDNSYEISPYGLLLIRLESDAMARRACDALELHMRKFNQAVVVDEGLQFDSGPVSLDFAIISRAIMWRDYSDPKLKAEAAAELEKAVDASRHAAWARRRGEHVPAR